VDKVIAVIGEVASSNTLAAAPILQEKGIPLVVPASTNVEITKVGDYISRVCFIDSDQGLAMANFCFYNLGMKKSAIIVDQSSAYSVDLAQYFINRFKELGGEVVAREAFFQGSLDFRTQLSKIVARNPDFIYLPVNYQEAGLLLKQAKELGIKAQIVGSDAWSSPKLFEIAGSAASDHFMTAHFSPEDTAIIVKNFVTEFSKRYGTKPSNMSALAYDAAGLLFAALRRCAEITPSRLRDELNKTKGFKGVTGDITLDSLRNPIKTIIILRTTKDGQFSFYGKVTPQK
jgi:branched-chain amino acid transport system substrate-binding protein